MKKLILIFYVLVVILFVSSCESKPNYEFAKINFDGYFDTNGYIVVEYNSKHTSFNDVQMKILPAVKKLLSKEEAFFAGELSLVNSTVKEINKNAGIKDKYDEPLKVKVSDELIEVLKIANDISSICPSFDVTIGPVSSLWNISSLIEYCQIEKNSNCKIPSEIDIIDAKKLVNYNNLIINEETNEVYLKEKGMSIDLGAIAKGYAVDQIEKLLIEKDFDFYIINFGGNVLVRGTSNIYTENNNDMKVSIQNPFSADNSALQILNEYGTFVTSSNSYRYIEINDQRYSHIIDPATGYPVSNDLESVTIIGEQSVYADAYSTTCFTLGLEKAIEFIENTSYKAVFITKDKNIYIVGDLNYTLIDNNLKIINRK